jgi:hypothetical protein
LLDIFLVQVMGVDPLRFAEVDYSSARNDFGGVPPLVGAFLPPKYGLPHAMIEPSLLMVAKAVLLA